MATKNNLEQPKGTSTLQEAKTKENIPLQAPENSTQKSPILSKSFQPSWGVDSVTPPYANVGNGESLYDMVVRVSGRRPAFWGRYLGGFYQIEPYEVQFLHERNCAIFLVYNGVVAATVEQGYDSGVSQANIAINAAQSLNVPQQIGIFLDTERGWQISPDFLGGWSSTIRNSRYYGAGGVYGNPTDPAFIWGYNEAFRNYPVMRQKPEGLVWSNQPSLNDTGSFIPEWNPSWPDTNPDGTVIYQYCIDVPSYGGYVDLNLCSPAAMAAAWRPVITLQVLATLALKPTHDHESKSIKTIFGGASISQLSRVTVTDPKTHKTEDWCEVSANGKVGWIPAAETKVV